MSVRPARPSKQPEAGESLGVLGEVLTSPQNALVKRAASLCQRKFREREGAFLVEGADLVLGGIACGHRPQVVFVAAERAEELAARVWAALGAAGGSGEGRAAAGRAAPAGGPAVFPVEERVAAKLSTLETAPDVIAVFPLPARPSLAAPAQPDALIVYADGIADPGNLGTLVRAAVAFGAAALATSPGSTDLFSPKTVRASMGAVFGLPLLPEQPPAELVARLAPRRVYGLAAHDGVPLAEAEMQRPALLVVGAERAGLSAAARAVVTDFVTIPLAPARPGVVESLNAGVAGAIALYELSRRPAGTTDPATTTSADSAKG